MCSILKDYEKFYIVKQEDLRIKECYQLQKFLACHNSKSAHSFHFNLVQTSLFSNFIESRFSNDDYG